MEIPLKNLLFLKVLFIFGINIAAKGVAMKTHGVYLSQENYLLSNFCVLPSYALRQVVRLAYFSDTS